MTRSLAEGTDCSLLQSVQTTFGARVQEALSQAVKPQGREANLSSPSSAEFKN